MMKVGLITITYNSDKYLLDFIESLNFSTSDFELILFVIDNASINDPEPIFANCILKKNIIKNKTNIGVAAANNQGARLALQNHCEVLIFLNNDIKFSSNAIDECSKYAIRNNAIVSPRIFDDNQSKNIWYENGNYNPFKGWAGSHINSTSEYPIQKVSYMPTCFSAMSTEVFKMVGEFDESFFVYFDDTDFMYRANKMDVLMCVLMNIEIIHKIGGSTGGIHSLFTAFQTSMNRLIFLKKHKGNILALCFTPIFLTFYLFLFILRRRSGEWLISAYKGTLQAWLK